MNDMLEMLQTKSGKGSITLIVGGVALLASGQQLEGAASIIYGIMNIFQRHATMKLEDPEARKAEKVEKKKRRAEKKKRKTAKALEKARAADAAATTK